jgi:putative ABC transport system permease protein
MFTLHQDLRFAGRQLWKDRTVAFVVVLTIALGIGVNTAVFSILNGFMRPLPVKTPDDIVVVAADTKGDETGFQFSFSYAALQDIRRQSSVFSDVFGSAPSIAGLSNGDRASQFLHSFVTGNYFSALGIQPVIGRFFEPGEGESAGSELTVVLGYSFWQKKFGGDPGVIGRAVRIDGRTATVIGVTSKDFHGLYAGADMDGYLPLRSQVVIDYPRSNNFFTSREYRSLTVYGRLAPGVNLKQAQAAMTSFARRLEEQYPETDQGIGIRIVPEPLARPFPLRFLADAAPLVRFFLLLLAALVLFLACMNVANVLLVRATGRHRELAIRAALGSGRWRLIRQMLTESMLLAFVGAVSGMVLGNWASRAFASSLDFGTDLPVRMDFSFDWRVFLYALTAAILTGIFVGIWPALRASQAQANVALHDGSRSNSGGPARQRARSLLVVGQVAGSLVLLVAAGLFIRSLQNAERVDLGFAPDHVLNATLDPLWAGYDVQRSKDFYRELGRRVRSWPEVHSASFAFSVPLGYYSSAMAVFLDERPINPGEQAPVIGCNFIDGDYFETMQIPIVRGRAFRESDNDTAPLVAIVNQAMADRLWPNQDPIGKRFHTRTVDSPLTEVIGVAKNAKYLALFEGTLPYLYVPSAQNFGPFRTLQVRTTVAPETLGPRLLQEIQNIDPSMPVADVQTMIRSLGGAHGFLIFRVGAIQAGSLGILGLVLAVVGVYGVVSYGAAQRTREIGIRMALGATPRSILQIILRDGLWMVLSGILVGLAGAAGLTRLLAQFLLLVSPSDPVTFLGVVVILAFVALGACYIPARRAMKVEPVIALRHE